MNKPLRHTIMNTSIIALNGLDAHRALVLASRTQNGFITGMLTASIHTLKQEMAKRIVRITFLKKNGTITTRFATTLPALTQNHINGRGYSSDYRNVVSFWDTEAEGENKWRSFRYEKLISFE